MFNKKKLAILGALATLLFTQSPEAFCDNAKVHLDVGLNHFYKNRYLEAYKEFKQAVEIDPSYAEAYYNLGRVYKAQGFIKEAIVEFQLAVRLKPDHVAAKRELDALTNSLANDVNQAMRIKGSENYRQTDFESMSAEDAEAKALQNVNAGKTDEAIRYYSIVARERPRDASVQKMLGFLNFKSNKFTDSMNNYQTARKLSPTDAEIPYAIGLIYMKTGSPNKAEDFFKDAIKLDSKMAKAYFALGEAYESQEKIDDAVFQFRKCLEVNPRIKEAQNKLDYMVGKQSYNYFSRGSYHYQRGEYEKALPLLSMAKSHGNLTADQRKQAEEMLNASQYWVNKQQAENRATEERAQVLAQSNISRTVSVYDVAANPNPYIGKAVEFEGYGEFMYKERGRIYFCVNSNQRVDPKNNLDHCFVVIVPKDVDDPRFSDYSHISVKGKITKVDKIFYESEGTFSSRKQPFLEAVEVKFTREGYDQPLVLRY